MNAAQNGDGHNYIEAAGGAVKRLSGSASESGGGGPGGGSGDDTNEDVRVNETADLL